MQVYRIQRDGPGHYTMVPNALVRDASLSAKAKGVWVALASHKDGYKQTLEAISKTHSDGVTAVGSALRELEVAGYLTRTQTRDDDGRLSDVVLTLVDRPQRQLEPQRGFPLAVNPLAVNPLADNHPPIRRLERQEEQKDKKTKTSTPVGEVGGEVFDGCPPGAPKPFREPLPDADRMTAGQLLADYVEHTDKQLRTTHAVWIVAHWTHAEIDNALKATARAGAALAYFRKVIESPMGTKRTIKPRGKPVPAEMLVGANNHEETPTQTPQKRTHCAEWAKALEVLAPTMSPEAFSTWLEPCDLVDGRLDTPTEFHAEMIRDRYQGQINEAMGREVAIGDTRESETCGSIEK